MAKVDHLVHGDEFSDTVFVHKGRAEEGGADRWLKASATNCTKCGNECRPLLLGVLAGPQRGPGGHRAGVQRPLEERGQVALQQADVGGGSSVILHVKMHLACGCPITLTDPAAPDERLGPGPRVRSAAQPPPVPLGILAALRAVEVHVADALLEVVRETRRSRVRGRWNSYSARSRPNDFQQSDLHGHCLSCGHEEGVRAGRIALSGRPLMFCDPFALAPSCV
mmetsp:Transcript_14715/g.42898  ORF Transcript_14715/g.42898 Transcript_14715/m.42898 type:complete len:224 (-) Transcript_14715:496-1167(-)